MATSPGTYKGITITGGTDAQVAAQIASIDNPTVPTTLTSQNTAPTTPISLTPPQDNTNYAGILAGAKEQALSIQNQITQLGQTSQTGTQTTPTTSPAPQNNEIQSYINSILGVQQPNYSQTYQKGYDASGLAGQQANVNAKTAVTTEAQGRLNNVSAQLQALATEAQAIPIQAQQQSVGRGITEAGLAPIQADQLRANALKALPLQAQGAIIQAEVANAQGQQKLAQDLYTQAQDHFDKMFTLQMQDAQNKYDFQTNLINKVYEFADRQQQRTLDAQKVKQEQDFQTQRDTIANQRQLERDKIQNAQDLAKINLQGSYSVKSAAAGNPTLPPTTQDTSNPQTVKDLATVNNINNVLANPDFASAFGKSGLVNQYIPGSPAQKVIADVEQVKDILSLAARGQLKGQGQISDFEGKMLANAQTALNGSLSADDAKQALINVRGAILTSSGGTTNVAITDPKTGETKIGQANSATITQAIANGYRVTYQQ